MNNQDDGLDKILDELSFNGINDVSYCPGGHKLEQYASDQAKTAILAWHNQQLEQAVIEAYKKGLLYNKQVHKDFSELGADVSIQAEIRRANAQLSKLKEHSS